jgi:hypothetical protein
MLWTIIVILVVLWLLGFLGHVGGSLIHLLLVIAVVVLITGGWRDSARLKMASAGMCFDDHPAASADDALDRESIMRLSKQRAAEHYGEAFACTVYVGDGVWDARACRSVGIPFIGIGTESRATRLSAEGAVCVFPDFSDADIFLRSVYEITNAA